MRNVMVAIGVGCAIVALLWCNACVGVAMWYPKGQSAVHINAPEYGSVDVLHNTSEIDDATTD